MSTNDDQVEAGVARSPKFTLEFFIDDAGRAVRGLDASTQLGEALTAPHLSPIPAA